MMILSLKYCIANHENLYMYHDSQVVKLEAHTKLTRLLTVFIRIVAVATINFSFARVRLLFEGGCY